MTEHFGSSVDEETATAVTSSSPDILDELRQEVAKAVDIEPLVLSVPNRPTISVVYMPEIDYDLLKKMLRRATHREVVDELRFAKALLAYVCRGLRLKGREVKDDAGGNMTIRSTEFHEMMGARDTSEAMDKLYASHGHIIKTAQEVMEAAGYGDMLGGESEEGFDPLED